MKKILTNCIALFLMAFSVSAQDAAPAPTRGRTTFFAELGGPGILFSANIDQRFNKSSRFGWGGRAGLGFVSYYEDVFVPTPGGGYYTTGDYASVVTFPLQVNYVFGRGNSPHTFEAGAGLTIAGRRLDIFNFNDARKSAVFGTAAFMYRRQPVDGGFSWRIGFTPVIAKGYIQPFGGVSVGYNF